MTAEEAGDIAEAERLSRLVIKGDPKDAAAPFNLGNMLRACGRKAEAEAALRAATRLDPSFAEAWYNLSGLLDEQGRSESVHHRGRVTNLAGVANCVSTLRQRCFWVAKQP